MWRQTTLRKDQLFPRNQMDQNRCRETSKFRCQNVINSFLRAETFQAWSPLNVLIDVLPKADFLSFREIFPCSLIERFGSVLRNVIEYLLTFLPLIGQREEGLNMSHHFSFPFYAGNKNVILIGFDWISSYFRCSNSIVLIKVSCRPLALAFLCGEKFFRVQSMNTAL